LDIITLAKLLDKEHMGKSNLQFILRQDTKLLSR